MNEFEKSLFSYDKEVEKFSQTLSGEIGAIIDGVRLTEVPGRGQFVFVRLRSVSSEVIQVYNGHVFPGYGLPVLVRWSGTRYEIVGVDAQRYPSWQAENPFIAKHGETHIMDKEGGRIGTDPAWIYPYQFMPSLVSPFPQDNIKNVYIHPSMIIANGNWKYVGNTGTVGLTDYSPITGSSLVLISLDTITGNPYLYATTGTYIPITVTGTSNLLTYLPSLDTARYAPLAFVILHSGTTNITWENLYDVRQFFTPSPTGTSYLNVNGIPGVSFINFDGAGVYFTGTSAFVVITGSSGGGGGHIIEDDGTPMTQREALNFVGFTVTDDAGNDATVITNTGSGSSGGGGAFQRVLSLSLSLDNGECLVVSGYINQGSHDIVLDGDSALHIIG